MATFKKTLAARLGLDEADAGFRSAERRARQGDPAAFHAHLRRQGEEAVKAHFAGHAKEFISAHKAHNDASDHFNAVNRANAAAHGSPRGERPDWKAAEEAKERLSHASNRFQAAHRSLTDAAHHHSQAAGVSVHPALHLHRGDASVEDHMHALAHLHGIHGRPSVEHSSKATHVTASQRQDHTMPFGFKGVDEFTKSVHHHYKVMPKVTKSGSTALIHTKLPLDKPTLKTKTESNDDVIDKLRDPEMPAEAPEGKAYVILWADGRAIVAFRKKADALAFVEHNKKGFGQGDVVWVHLDKPFTKKGTRISVRNSFSPSKTEQVQLTRTPLQEALSPDEHQALAVMAQKHEAGFADEFWVEHRRNTKMAEFSEQFEQWDGWDGRDETRQEAWERYKQSSEFKERQKAILQIEEREINPDGSISCGIFIPLPYDLARQFPDKKLEDDSVPHFTLLYLGDMSPDDFRKAVTVVRALALAIKPFYLDLARYSEFQNHKGQVIAHMQPSLPGASALARLHGLLRRGLEALDVKVEHGYGPDDAKTPAAVPYEVRFKSHATLAYQPPTQPYTGPKPTGSWLVNELEVWGHERIRVPLGAIDYRDSGSRLQRSALGMQLYLARKPYPRATPPAATEGK